MRSLRLWKIITLGLWSLFLKVSTQLDVDRCIKFTSKMDLWIVIRPGWLLWGTPNMLGLIFHVLFLRLQNLLLFRFC